uniref:Gustatory receptor n=1 Tax=Anopheles dirus TaxID=7168 RepID=A0A182NR10_9DIPT
VYDVGNLHLFSLKLFGDLYLSRNRTTGQLYISWKSFASFVGRLVCLVVLIVWGHVVQQQLSGSDATYLHQAVGLLINFSGMFAVTISISNAMVGKQIWGILEQMDKFDKWMRVLNAPVDHRTEKRVVLQWSLMLFVGVVFFTSAFTIVVSSLFANPILKIVIAAEMAIFVVLIVSMPTSFFMNEFTTVNQYRRCTDSRLFGCVLEAFEALYEAMQLTHKAYAVQLFSMTVSNIPTPTLALFAMYRSLVTSNYDMQYLIITMSVSSVMYLLTYLMLILLSTNIKREVNRLIQSYHHFTNLHNVEFERLVKDSTNHISSRRITLHLGPMELNWKLAFSMLGIIVSYLIILIQFDRSSDFNLINTQT